MKKRTIEEEREYQKNLVDRMRRVIEHRLERDIDHSDKENPERDEYVNGMSDIVIITMSGKHGKQDDRPDGCSQ